jgi:hypothetical protein
MYYNESLTLTPEELVIMANQRYMLMKTKGTFSNAITSRKESSRKEVIKLRAEIRDIAKKIPQVTNDKSPDEVFAFAIRSSSGKLHTSSEPCKQVPGTTTTTWVAAQESSCRLSSEDPSTRTPEPLSDSLPKSQTTRTPELLSESLPKSQTTRSPINLTEDSKGATGTHAMLFGTATITH